MKTIVNAVESPNVAQVVSKGKYYGIVSPFSMSKRGFICREKYDSGKYNTICSNCLTNHNYWDEYENESLAGLINQLIAGKFTVYEFDTPQELFTWLAEKG